MKVYNVLITSIDNRSQAKLDGRVKGMAGTRTAPLFTAAATNRIISLALIDASGDMYSEALYVDPAATAANIETWAAAYAAASNASLYAIYDTVAREGEADPDNAVAAFRATVAEGINLALKDLVNLDSLGVRVVAPVAATLQGNQDIPLVTSDEIVDILTILLILKPSFFLTTAQFTGRRERKNNPKIKV